jgi:hypothetical protein
MIILFNRIKYINFNSGNHTRKQNKFFFLFCTVYTNKVIGFVMYDIIIFQVVQYKIKKKILFGICY